MDYLSAITIFAGAGIGALVRWGLGLALNPLFPTVPLGTLASNVLGGLLMGTALGVFAQFESLPPAVRRAVTTGFLGGLTTFSTFSAEASTLLLRTQYAWAPAVIVDVDETVLDNSAFQARLVRDHRAFDESTWRSWDTLKIVIGRVRPSLQNLSGNTLSIGFVGDSSAHSMPSGHTADLMISAVFIGFLLPRRWQRYGCMALAALLSSLRVITVKHWPSDVLAGVLIGGGGALLALKLMMTRGARADRPA